MTDDNQIRLRSRLDALAHPASDDGAAFWFARDLMEPLGYARRENFRPAIRRAAASCKGADKDGAPHFRGVVRMMPDGKGVERPVTDFKLTRHACHLIAMSGDPRREPIAFARDYFAPRTLAAKTLKKPEGDRPRDAAGDRQPESAPAAASIPVAGEPTSSPVAPASDAGGKKNSGWGIPVRGHGHGGSPSNSRFIPHSGGHQFQGKWNQNRNAAWNQNLAVGRGHPNSGARNSK